MLDFESVVDAYAATITNTKGGLSGRLAFWCSRFYGKRIDEITADDVDLAVADLIQRGRLKGGRGSPTEFTGKPLAPATVDRYVGDLAGVFKYARRMRLVRRDLPPPTAGIEKLSKTTYHDRFFTREQVERLVIIARVTDTRWRKLPALIVLAYTTGLRKGALMALRWRDIDFERRTIHVARTKNDDPHMAILTDWAANELERLHAVRNPMDYVFSSRRHDRPFDFRAQWEKALSEAGYQKLNFHSLRHGCGHALAQSGESQPAIMAYMGHRSIAASARYMHSNHSDKQRVAAKVFG